MAQCATTSLNICHAPCVPESSRDSETNARRSAHDEIKGISSIRQEIMRILQGVVDEYKAKEVAVFSLGLKAVLKKDRWKKEIDATSGWQLTTNKTPIIVQPTHNAVGILTGNKSRKLRSAICFLPLLSTFLRDRRLPATTCPVSIKCLQFLSRAPRRKASRIGRWRPGEIRPFARLYLASVWRDVTRTRYRILPVLAGIHRAISRYDSRCRNCDEKPTRCRQKFFCKLFRNQNPR